jgi:hypothetical protein
VPVAVTVVSVGRADAAASPRMTGSFEEGDEEYVLMLDSRGKADDHY